MTKNMTPVQENYRLPGDFVLLLEQWRVDAVEVLLGFVWAGFDKLKKTKGFVVQRANANVERGYTQQLAQCIRDSMNEAGSFFPFYLEHHPFEDETMVSSKACPKAPDLAFVWRANPRAMLPLEAKQMVSDGVVADYVNDMTTNFLGCKYGPFSGEAAMVAYLRAGTPSVLLQNIGRSLKARVVPHPRFKGRDHAYSDHVRKVKKLSGFSRKLRCHHIVFVIG